MWYMCRDCLGRFKSAYMYWFCESGAYICINCLAKNKPPEVVKSVLQCENETMDMYILEGTNFRKAKSAEEWGEFISRDNKPPHHRSVAVDDYKVEGKQFCSLSTVFIGMDHSFNSSGTPVLFESMIFDGEHLNEEIQRYSSYAEASLGHRELRTRILNVINNRFRVSTVTLDVKSDKYNVFLFTSDQPTYIVSGENDIRLIREN